MRDLYGLDVTIYIVQEIGADFNLLSIVWLGRAIKVPGIESLKYARGPAHPPYPLARHQMLSYELLKAMRPGRVGEQGKNLWGLCLIRLGGVVEIKFGCFPCVINQLNFTLLILRLTAVWPVAL